MGGMFGGGGGSSWLLPVVGVLAGAAIAVTGGLALAPVATAMGATSAASTAGIAASAVSGALVGGAIGAVGTGLSEAMTPDMPDFDTSMPTFESPSLYEDGLDALYEDGLDALNEAPVSLPGEVAEQEGAEQEGAEVRKQEEAEARRRKLLANQATGRLMWTTPEINNEKATVKKKTLLGG